MLDRLKYEIFYRLWDVWHCRLRRFKPFMNKLVDHYDPELFEPNEIAMLIEKFGHRVEYRDWCSSRMESRPWWHLCCNGDAGGWRTRLCDYLEHKWRGTNYYNRES